MTDATDNIEKSVDDARPAKEEAEETTETDTQDKSDEEADPKPEKEDGSAAEEGETDDEAEGDAAAETAEEADDKSIISPDDKKPDDALVSDVEDETPKERALRIELKKTRDALKDRQKGDVKFDQPIFAKKELPPEKKKILEKYKPDEVRNLKEVFEVLADDMGFVKADQLGATTYQEKASEALDTFLEDHPEYKVTAGKENPLWQTFTDEFKLFKQPNDVRDLKKIFNRIHQSVMGVRPSGDLNRVKAGQQKIKVASHAGAPGNAARVSIKNGQRLAPQRGLRTDMLKGFTADEVADIESGQV